MNRVLRLAAVGVLSGFAMGQGFSAEWKDDFEDAKAWKATNEKAPARFETAGGILTLTALPGGEVTWGTSLYRGTLTANLDDTPFLVAKIVEMTGGFHVKLVNPKTGEKVDTLRRVSKSGLAVENIRQSTGWSGPIQLSIGLYVMGVGKAVKLDWIKLTDHLTPEEEQALNELPKADAGEKKAASQPAESAVKYHGLTELAARQGWRRLEDTQRGASYLTERTVYRDSATGALVWRMTCDPAVDVNDYYDIPAWNANGSLIAFESRRASGPRERWLMDANGANLRPFPTPDGQPIATGYWSILYPDRFYHTRKDDTGTRVVATNPYTGEERVVASAPKALDNMQPPHPSEQWFLFGTQPGKDDTSAASMAHVLGVDGSLREVAFEKRWHRLRFTKSPDQRLFFNFDDPREQFTILPDGSGRTFIPDPGSHPDWLVGGKELTYFAAGAIWGVQWDGTGKRLIMQHNNGGHGGPCLDGEYYVADTPKRGDYPDSILYIRTDGSQVCHTIAKHMSAYLSHSSTWHPDHHTTHPHPVASPDGTKILYNSDFLGKYTDIYVAIARLPDPPRDLQSRVEGGVAVLTWQPPRRSHETRGYLVYRRTASHDYRRVTPQPVAGLEWRGAPEAEPGYYVVTSVEYSGLESRPSGEVFEQGADQWQGPARIVLEAEAGQWMLPMRETFDPRTAANLYCVGNPERQGGDGLAFGISAPKKAPYRLWARVRGAGALSVESDGRKAGAIDCAGEAWTWRSLDSTLPLDKGDHNLKLTSLEGGEFVDQLLLTDDPAFEAKAALTTDAQAPDAPRGLAATPVFTNAIRLSWSKPQADDVDHYNVYCGRDRGFTCAQASLIGSPSETEMVDWGLRLNAAYFYKATAVDGAGNESAPSEAVEGRTPPFEPVHVSLKSQAGGEEPQAGDEEPQAGDEVPQDAQEWEFDLPRDGDYAIWVRSMHDKQKRAAFDLFFDGAKKDTDKIGCAVWGLWGKWNWSPAGRMVTGSPQRYAFTAGRHTLRLKPKTNMSPLKEVVITDDPTFPGE
ncbi:MAG: fibronectin type III domain-containing protein [Candidatus Sumerlaeota bacterium]|nr:fibronectin type III domain-containing protein [Candidatus Sumerlaeota bacterium]